MTRILYIIRGPSGSGKTTASIAADCVFFEADDWFKNNQAEYVFDPKELHNAHAFCRLSVERAMRSGESDIFVSNTSMTLKEIQPYLDLAKKYNYEVEVWRTPGPWDPEVLFKRNKHNVPLETIKRQIARYEPYPDEQVINSGYYKQQMLDL